MTKKVLLNGIVIGIILCMILIMYHVTKESNEAEHELFVQGTEYFTDGNFESAYSIFDTIYKANHNWYNTDKRLNKKFDNITNLRIMSYDGMMIDKIAECINIDQDYKKALEYAFKINDESTKNENVEEIIFLISEDAINNYTYKTKGGSNYDN